MSKVVAPLLNDVATMHRLFVARIVFAPDPESHMRRSLLLLALLMAMLLFALNAEAQWTQRANCSGFARFGAASFTIGEFGYIVGGRDSLNNDLSETWSYRAPTDHWQAKAGLPVGKERRMACGWSIGNMGYVCCGEYNNSSKRNDLWQFDATNNNWVQRASMPGAARYGAYSFVINGVAYLGGGNAVAQAGPYQADLYSYDPLTNQWTTLTGIPDQGRFAATAFTVGDTAYVFGGKLDDQTLTNALWRYVPATGWSQVTAMPSNGRMYAMAWSGADQGMIAGGEVNNLTVPDAWAYRPLTNDWIYVPPYPGAGGWAGCTFNINDTAYAGLGQNSVIPERDLWELDLSHVNAVGPVPIGSHGLAVVPSLCASGTSVRLSGAEELLRSVRHVYVYDLTGRRVTTAATTAGVVRIPRMETGRYVLDVSFADGSERALPITVVN